MGLKKAGYILFAVLFFVMCALPVLGMPLERASVEGEELAPLPKLYTREEGINSAFGEETETWLVQNFAGREELVTANARLRQAVFATSAEGQVILGEDGWLFYELTLEDYLGTDPLSEQEMVDIAATMALIQEYANDMGSDFLFTVAPNKNSIHGEYMPYYTVPAREENDLAALAGVLDEADVSYLDLYGILKDTEGLYYKRDTHWNNEGARVAYDEMMNQLGQPHDSFATAPTSTVPIEALKNGQIGRADLDRLLYPVDGVSEDGIEFDIDYDSLYRFEGPARVNLGRLVTKSDVAEGSLLMFRDSFGNALIQFVSTAFGDVTYISATPHTPDLLQPGQTLVIEIVQRNLRVLLAQAPRMPAPERVFEGSVERANAGSSILVSEEKGDYLHVYGAIPAEQAEGADALLVAVESGDDISYYEAFPVMEEGLEGAGGNGRGFSLYIPLTGLPANYDLFPVAQFKNELTIFGT